ncbi:MAG: aminoacyltransferase [Firmicutes bacterium]|nr:aminoacyltransferase [Bacillota bacterium]
MRFCELTEQEFRDFSSTHELHSFFQTPEMAKSKQEDGCNCYYVGVKKDNKILCATLLIEYKGRLFKTFSSPRGYLIDFRNKELLNFFTNGLKKFISKKGGTILNIEPKILYKERDMNGDIVDGGFDNSDIYNNLIDLGYKHNGFYLELDLKKQVRWAYILDLKNKTEEQVFNEFKPNTRNIIRKAIKYGIYVRELSLDELDIFKQLVDSSGELKNFKSSPLKYYQKMYRTFKPLDQIKFMVAELDLNEYSLCLNKELEEYNQKISKLGSKSDSKKKEYQTQIDVLTQRLEDLSVKRKGGDKVILAGGMFILYGKEIAYIFSGTSTKFRNFQAQYLVQWEMIKHGIYNGYNTYDFYGISGDFSKDNKRHGLYEFKKSFGGNVIEYIGDFDLIISPLKYFLKKLISRFGGK